MKGLTMKKLVFSMLLCCKSVFAEGETPLIVNDPELHAGQATVIGKMVDRALKSMKRLSLKLKPKSISCKKSIT